jgi:hypothetical protein
VKRDPSADDLERRPAGIVENIPITETPIYCRRWQKVESTWSLKESRLHPQFPLGTWRT